ncbi:hypothetical protein DER44DRAFT_794450 [Fusarium oxysporum]|nr:hypothetical protein DER44DRAFT_794450 [Fusarium oxysporum]
MMSADTCAMISLTASIEVLLRFSWAARVTALQLRTNYEPKIRSHQDSVLVSSIASQHRGSRDSPGHTVEMYAGAQGTILINPDISRPVSQVHYIKNMVSELSENRSRIRGCTS